MLQWLRNSRSNSCGLHRRGLRLVSTYYAPGSLPQWLYPLSPSPPLPPVPLLGIPTLPGYNQPVQRQPKSAASRLHPLFPPGLRLRLPQFLFGKSIRQGGQRHRLVPFNPHRIIPSVADYGLAQVPLSVQGVHGQQPQAGIALEQLAQLLPQHPGFVPLLRGRPLGQAQLQVMGQHVHHDQGISVGVPGLLGPLAVH